ncbi:MAG TPA: hypothetical protein VJ894_00090 [Cryomorphaceae bacterium]|nr:hypothetical protein [Cryomorphaceae bacterium]
MKTLFTFLVLGLGVSALGQADFDTRLLAKYSEERINQLLEEQPSVIEYWTYYLDHSFTIVDEQSGKSFLTDETIKIKDVENFNVLELDIYMDRKKPKAYRIKGTNKFLILKSNDQFSQAYSLNRS